MIMLRIAADEGGEDQHGEEDHKIPVLHVLGVWVDQPLGHPLEPHTQALDVPLQQIWIERNHVGARDHGHVLRAELVAQFGQGPPSSRQKLAQLGCTPLAVSLIWRAACLC